MHRTQILLEEVQYHQLSRYSRETGKSLSQLIREWVNEKLNLITVGKKETLLEFVGSGESQKPLSRDELKSIDHVIYGSRERFRS